MEHLNDGSSHSKSGSSDSCMITFTRGSKEEWLDNIMKDTSKRRTRIDPRINRVPHWLLEIEANKKCFDPAVVSIGPYHHGKPKLSTIEKVKSTSARRFVSGCGSNIHDVYRKVEFVTFKARKYYADDSTMANFDNESFTRMMFLDGCFILDFIERIMFGGNHIELMTFGQDIPSILRDLFLLENQLPYLILKVLMEFKYREDEGEEMVHEFIKLQIGPQGYYFEGYSLAGRDSHIHILDLFRTKLVGDSPNRNIPKLSYADWRSYPPVKELKAMGIKFKRSDTSSLNDISFRSHMVYGELSLPPTEFNHSTKEKFLNLIAYELSSDFDYSIISYICFLDTLIDHADDVTVLRSEAIIYNCLGSDKEVANLVNQLAIGLVHGPLAYSKVVKSIHSHCKEKKKVYIGEIMQTHFNSPWTTIAFFAASFAILLSCIQTFFTVFPR